MRKKYEDRISYVDGVQHLSCNLCYEIKPHTSFGWIKAKQKYTSSCKKCLNERGRDFRHKRKDGYDKHHWVIQENQEDIKSMLILLTQLGYDVKQEIEPQFRERVLNKYGVVLKETKKRH